MTLEQIKELVEASNLTYIENNNDFHIKNERTDKIIYLSKEWWNNKSDSDQEQSAKILIDLMTLGETND